MRRFWESSALPFLSSTGPYIYKSPAATTWVKISLNLKRFFSGRGKRATEIPPRAVDIQDIDTTQIGKIVVRILEEKGYQVFLANPPLEDNKETVDRLMAQYQESHPHVDAFLFCYFAPTLFVSHAREVPPGHTKESYSLEEIVGTLSPVTDSVIWVGQRDQNSPSNSISHAFIYWAMTMFNATTGQPIMLQADSRGGGPIRPWIPRCPPAPTRQKLPGQCGYYSEPDDRQFQMPPAA